MPTDILTRILSAAPGIRAELWQAAHADAIEQLATAIAERDIARADRDAELDADSVRGAAHAERVAELSDALAAAESERDALRESSRSALENIADDLLVDTLGLTPTDIATRCGASIERLKDKVTKLEARPALTVERLAEAMGVAIAEAEAKGWRKAGWSISAADIIAKLGPVALPAQDRAEELARLIAVEPIRTGEWKALVERVRAALVKVGAPPPEVATTPTPSRNPALTAASLLRKISRVGLAQGGEQSPNAAECIDVAMRLESSVGAQCKGAPPPSVAPGPVLAGVSEGDIACIAANAHRECIDGSPWMAVARAVVARLGASLVAPVDPEAVARSFEGYLCEQDRDGWEEWQKLTNVVRREMTAAMCATLTAHGAPPPAVAPGPVLAGVSLNEVARVWWSAFDRYEGDIDDEDRARARAVVARLGASLVAPVDPEAVARGYHDHDIAPTATWTVVVSDDAAGDATRAMRATLKAAGIPVTPEAGK